MAPFTGKAGGHVAMRSFMAVNTVLSGYVKLGPLSIGCVATGTGNGNVSACQRIACFIVCRRIERRRFETVHIVTGFAPIVVGSAGKLSGVSIFMTISARGKT